MLYILPAYTKSLKVQKGMCTLAHFIIDFKPCFKSVHKQKVEHFKDLSGKLTNQENGTKNRNFSNFILVNSVTKNGDKPYISWARIYMNVSSRTVHVIGL